MKTTLIHFLNPGKQLQELNAEFAMDALKRHNTQLAQENDELRQRLAGYGDMSPEVLDKVTSLVTQDLQGDGDSA